MVVTGRNLGRALCRAIGIDANKVRNITIHADAKDVAYVTLKVYAPADLREFDEVIEMLRSADEIVTEIQFVDRRQVTADEEKLARLQAEQMRIESEIAMLKIGFSHKEE
jgi:hypothetical protein